MKNYSARSAELDELWRRAQLVAEVEPLQRRSFVYYLMVGPATVKIGTTTSLRDRILHGLRSELQYVVALELGDYALERQRHREFAVERIGRREDFRLSDRLKDHITSLQSQRDELLRVATR